MAARGYVVLHVDYRGHAGSSPATQVDQAARLGYTEDVVGAVLTLKKQPYVDADRVGTAWSLHGWGSRLQRAGRAARTGARRGRLRAGAARTRSTTSTAGSGRTRPGRTAATRSSDASAPPRQRPGFWRAFSPRTYFDRVTEPLLVHHGTADDTCPLPWSRETVRLLRRAGKDVTFYLYPGEQHAFGPQWELSMERTLAFLKRSMPA